MCILPHTTPAAALTWSTPHVHTPYQVRVKTTSAAGLAAGILLHAVCLSRLCLLHAAHAAAGATSTDNTAVRALWQLIIICICFVLCDGLALLECNGDDDMAATALVVQACAGCVALAQHVLNQRLHLAAAVQGHLLPAVLALRGLAVVCWLGPGMHAAWRMQVAAAAAATAETAAAVKTATAAGGWVCAGCQKIGEALLHR